MKINLKRKNSITKTTPNKKQKTEEMNFPKKTNQNTKKLIINPIKKVTKIPENFEKENWEILKNSIYSVFNNEKGKYTFEELYKVNYFFIIIKKDCRRYDNIKIKLKLVYQF
jgi:hypothetical protein